MYSTSSDSVIKKLQKQPEGDPEDGPIKYTTSPAQYWRAKYSRQGKMDDDNILWYEPYVIMGSLSVFLIYFLILREENDLDEELSKSLYSRIDGLEETQLRLSLKYNIEHGLETQPIVDRLKEIELSKKLSEECK